MAKELGLIELSYRGRKRLLRAEINETYVDGKDLIIVSRGFHSWREDVNPQVGDNFVFTACDGTETTVAPMYGGTLAFVVDAPLTIQAFCPL